MNFVQSVIIAEELKKNYVKLARYLNSSQSRKKRRRLHDYSIQGKSVAKPYNLLELSYKNMV